MRVVIQRVKNASVEVAEESYRKSIGQGLLILLGIETSDNDTDIAWLIRKVVQMRIFNDEGGKMNKSVKQVKGQIMVISQFTLHASTKKGNRPSFIKAAGAEQAIPLYERFINELRQENLIVKSGIFGANMDVTLVNYGPVTIIIDSKHRS